MKTLSLGLAALVAVLTLAPRAGAQAPKPDCPPPSASPRAGAAARAPERIEGEVVGIDRARGMLTVRTPDGRTQEFRGSKDTLAEYKVGDRIEARLRAEPGC